jgi:hypothetical protein
VWIELKILAWLVVEDQDATNKPMVFLPASPPPQMVKK